MISNLISGGVLDAGKEFREGVVTLLAIVANFDLQYGLEFDCNQEVSLTPAARTPHRIAFSDGC